MAATGVGIANAWFAGVTDDDGARVFIAARVAPDQCPIGRAQAEGAHSERASVGINAHIGHRPAGIQNGFTGVHTGWFIRIGVGKDEPAVFPMAV